jgi:hypothetical protein
MNQSSLMNSAKKLFSQLYAIDIEQLDKEAKQTHREALNAAYITVLDLENDEFRSLLNANSQVQEELVTATEQLAQAVIQEKKLSKKVQLAARGLEAIQKIIKS